MSAVLGEELTGLYVGRCPSCKSVNTRQELRPWYYPLNFVCQCGRTHKVKPVIGRLSDKRECGARCTSATGGRCECTCSGRNHAADHRS